MVLPLSLDIRKRMAKAVAAGASRNSVAKRFDVAASTVIKLMQHAKATGSLVPKRMGGYRKYKLAAHDALVRELVRGTPDATLDELVIELAKRGVETSRSGLNRYLGHIGWSFKKNSGFTTNMVRRYGRCPIGQRLVAKSPYGHWRTTTFIAALRRDGLDAPMTLDGPMNGEIFRAWTEQFLAPALKPGDIVIMDNLPSHKVCGIRQTIEAVRARLIYLPPYSPDLNPIEQVFAKFKAALRKAAARTVTRLWQEIAKTLNTFSPRECAAYLKHCGYAN